MQKSGSIFLVRYRGLYPVRAEQCPRLGQGVVQRCRECVLPDGGGFKKAPDLVQEAMYQNACFGDYNITTQVANG